tara:strand:+ start:9346 stop:10764 length:1419 start_codon:yes stop_codon:yes gene_type:complete
MTALRTKRELSPAPRRSDSASQPERPKRLPRYTSYPTALQFGPLKADQARRWLDEVPEQAPLSLYFHIPYCDQLCWFCGCYTHISNHYGPVEKYLSVLIEELRQTAARLFSDEVARRKVSHIHFGGGSPTLLKAEDFARLMKVVSETFDILPDAEIAVEVDPRTLSAEKVRTYAEQGVNRVSMGVQDFNPRVQKAINRIQPAALIEECLGWFQDVGISKINFDLIYGLPHQTLDSIRETVMQSVSYTPSRIALFGYAHVPWLKKHQRMIPTEALPDQALRQQMFAEASAQLEQGGYRAIGLDHFARPGDPLLEARDRGRLKRNFQGYTNDPAEVLIGFGASAISSLPGGYVQNTADMKDYQARILAGRSAARRGVGLRPRDLLMRTIISDLMCMFEVNPEARAKQLGVTYDFGREKAGLHRLICAGYMCQDGDVYRITEAGRPYLRAICTLFDEYFPQDSDILHRCIHESEG